jgi:F0F1-type ATP synthase membrane subunit b/b'
MINLLPDHTLPLMWVFFMVVLFVLNNFVFKPTLEIIEARNAKTLGLKEKAEKLSASVTKRLEAYEVAFNKARHLAATEREKILVQARSEERSIIDTARGQTDKMLSEIRQNIRAEKDVAAGILKKEVEQLADSMLTRVLER